MELAIEKRQASLPTKIKVFNNPTPNDLTKQADFYVNSEIFSVHYLTLLPNEFYTVTTNEYPQLMFAYQGSVEITDNATQIHQQEFFTFPKNKTFQIKSGNQGLQAISFTIQQAISEDKIDEIKKNLNYFDSVIIFNNQRIQQFSENSFFEFIKNGSLYDPQKRQKLLDCIRLCSAAPNIFEVPSIKNTFSDSVLIALRDWFFQQMIVLDHIEKNAIIYFVISHANAVYSTIIQNYLPMYDEVQTQLLYSPLNNTNIVFNERNFYKQNLESLIRINKLIEQAWNSIEAMTQRIVDLIA